MREKIKGYAQSKLRQPPILPDDLFLGLIIILVAFGSFGLGRLSKIEGAKTPIRIENVPTEATRKDSPGVVTSTKTSQSASIIGTTGNDLVGSKNGKKYYYPWCSGVKSISPANLIHFADKNEAEARGYSPATACKGL